MDPAHPSYLVMKAVSKSFPGVKALHRASLEVCSGECHALVGENGAGKSTLMKILAGATLPDSAEIRLDGKLVEIPSPLVARQLGISMIYQELNLIQELTVAENIFLGREPGRSFGLLDRRRMFEESRELLGRLHQSIDPRRRARELSLAEQQIVEIVKALFQEARVLIMDEPSSILTEREMAELFDLVSRMKSQGLAIIYISHRLEEVFRACDRVTVMRDGKTIATHEVSTVTRQTMIKEMVGRELSQIFPSSKKPGFEQVLEVTSVSRGSRLQNITLNVRRGEIVGLAGLVGAGRSDLARAIFGADPIDEGEIRYEGERLRGHTPRESVRRGLGLLTEDRKAQGLLLNMTVRENITLANLARVSRRGFISRARERGMIEPLVAQLKIKTPSVEQGVAKLSGGNQQKTLVARWLFVESRFLMFDEPTRGIDVGAKAEIYQLIVDLAAEGRSILVISSELPELLGLCHRIYVMRDGALTGEFTAAEATQELLLSRAMDVAPPA